MKHQRNNENILSLLIKQRKTVYKTFNLSMLKVNRKE